MSELDLTVTNTWMDASSEQEQYTRSWTEPAQTQKDFFMVPRKLEAKQMQVKDFDWFNSDHMGSCFFIEIATETLCETWSEFERTEVKRNSARSSPRR